MEWARYWMAVLLVIGLPPGVGWWFLVHPFIGFWRKLGPHVTLTIMALCLLASMAGLFVIRDRLLGADLGTHWPLVVLAVPFLVAGGMIQWRRRKLLTFRILAGVPEIAPKNESRLLTEGIYARIRHPRYVEFALGAIGWAFFANHVGAYAVAILMLGLIYLVVLLEERELRERFGAEYEEYCRRVPRFLPRRG